MEDVSEADAPAQSGRATTTVADARVVAGEHLTAQYGSHPLYRSAERQYNVRVHMSTRHSNAVQLAEISSVLKASRFLRGVTLHLHSLRFEK